MSAGSTPPPSHARPTTARPVDLEAFARDIQALRRAILADQGEADITHLRKIERWGRAATALGLATWDPLESTCRHASLSIL